jgi:hypothetical protein
MHVEIDDHRTSAFPPARQRDGVNLAEIWANFHRTFRPARPNGAKRGRAKMRIAKVEDFHVDGGWDTYSFLGWGTDIDEAVLRAHPAKM